MAEVSRRLLAKGSAWAAAPLVLTVPIPVSATSGHLCTVAIGTAVYTLTTKTLSVPVTYSNAKNCSLVVTMSEATQNASWAPTTQTVATGTGGSKTLSFVRNMNGPGTVTIFAKITCSDTINGVADTCTASAQLVIKK